jgi:apolipoprotein N-acyltransferase
VSSALLATSQASLARAFRTGVVAGLVYFGGTLYWVASVMENYGGLSTWVAVPVALLLVSYLALYPGLFAMMITLAVRRFGVAGVWFAPWIWVATEWLRSWLGSGFPWALLGTSQATVLPIVQLASVTGVYGLSVLVALVGTAAASVALTTRPRHRLAVAGVGLLLVVIAAAGALRIAGGSLLVSGTPSRVGLVQGNVDQSIKYDPAHRDAIVRTHIDLSRQVIGAGVQLVIWPEASTPFYFDVEGALAAPIRRLAVESRTPFIIGSDEFDPGKGVRPDRYYNSAVLVGSDGRSQAVYRKLRLVPFGEYVPLKRLLFFVGPLIEAVSDFSFGTEPVVFDADGRRVSVAICYESIYPWIARAFVVRGSQLLATITNDAWFGRSSAAYQHFEQGAIRAVEEGRYIVRAANTGFSGAVDPYGRTIAQTRLFEPAAITVDVRLLDHRTIYSYLGDVVAWLGAAVTVALVLMSWRRRRSAGL